MSDAAKFMVVRTDRPSSLGAAYWVADYTSDADSWVAVASYCVTAVIRRPEEAGRLARALLAAMPAMLAIPENRHAISEIFNPLDLDSSGVVKLLTRIGEMSYGKENAVASESQGTQSSLQAASQADRRPAAGPQGGV